MIFIPTEHLKSGMVIARDINFDILSGYNFPLLTKGQKLTPLYINKLSINNITGVYVESKITNDIIVNDSIDKKLKVQALKDIKNVFEDFKSTKCVMTNSDISKISSIAKELVESILSKDEFTINLIDLKSYDDYTYHHSLCVAIYSISTGLSLGLGHNSLNELAMCALLHDIGKMAVPIEIINKPSSLTKEEFEIIKQHPESAVQHLRKNHLVPSSVLSGIENHHEKFDGTGYPNGRKGRSISLYGRILAVCDVYDALTSNRPYRKQCLPNEAIEYMMGCADVHFDYEILIAFLKNVAAYPVGMCVSLSNGNIAVIVKNISGNILRPIIRIINKDGTSGDEIDLSTDKSYTNVTITGIGYEDEKINYGVITNS